MRSRCVFGVKEKLSACSVLFVVEQQREEAKITRETRGKLRRNFLEFAIIIIKRKIFYEWARKYSHWKEEKEKLKIKKISCAKKKSSSVFRETFSVAVTFGKFSLVKIKVEKSSDFHLQSVWGKRKFGKSEKSFGRFQAWKSEIFVIFKCKKSFFWSLHTKKVKFKFFINCTSEKEEGMADKNKTGDFYSRPEKTTSKNFIWNSETGQFLGRTGGSWGKKD